MPCPPNALISDLSRFICIYYHIAGNFCMIDKSTLRIIFCIFKFRMLAVGDCTHVQLIALAMLARPCPIAVHVPQEGTFRLKRW
jgi:hypothetical protein